MAEEASAPESLEVGRLENPRWWCGRQVRLPRKQNVRPKGRRRRQDGERQITLSRELGIYVARGTSI